MSTQLIIAGLLAVSCFSGGWLVRGWKADSDIKAENTAVEKIVTAFDNHQINVGALLEVELARLINTRLRMEKDYAKTVAANPTVYNSECLDDAGLRLLEQARTGKAGPSQPVSPVPAAPK